MKEDIAFHTGVGPHPPLNRRARPAAPPQASAGGRYP